MRVSFLTTNEQKCILQIATPICRYGGFLTAEASEQEATMMIEGSPSTEISTDELGREMEALVEQTKKGLRWAITSLSLRLDSGFFDETVEMYRRSLEKARINGDQSAIERSEEMIASFESYRQRAPEELRFLRDVQEGHLPDDWSVKPQGWLYSYDGIYRHNVTRVSYTLSLLEEELGRPHSDAELRALIISENTILARLRLGRELDTDQVRKMVLSGDPEIAKIAGE